MLVDSKKLCAKTFENETLPKHNLFLCSARFSNKWEKGKCTWDLPKRMHVHRNLPAAKCWHLTPLWTLHAAGVGLNSLPPCSWPLTHPSGQQPQCLKGSSQGGDCKQGEDWVGILAREQSVFNGSHQKAVHQWLPKRSLAELVEIFCWYVTSFCEFVNSCN